MKNKNKISKINFVNKDTNIHLNLYLLLILLIIIQIKGIKINKLNLNSEITLIINGTGTQQILYNRSFMVQGISGLVSCATIPDEIYINDEYQNYTDFYVYNLTKEINKVTVAWYSQLERCNCMFLNLDNIIKIDFSKFDASKVTQMYNMFYGCSSLTSIDFTNFYTPLVTGINYMFFHCYSLKSLDLRTFNTSLVVDMQNMFYECNSLKYLDVSSFNTSSVKIMKNMFTHCSSITSLDLRSFNTSSVEDLSHMFSNCQSLKIIKFNFNTLNVIDMTRMFYFCSSIIFLDLRSFDTPSLNKSSEMFENIRTNVEYCYNESKIHTFAYNTVRDMIFNCSSECFSTEQYSLILEKSKCIEKCSSDDTYKYDFNGICYENCPDNTNSIIHKKLCCLDTQPYSIIESIKCSEECNILDFFNEKCEVNSDESTILNDNIIYIQNKLLNEESKDILINHLITNSNDLSLKKNNILYQLTTSVNQRNNANENEARSTINMENCERHLRNHYIFESLIIFKIEYYEEGLLIPIIEYEIYDIENNTKLNLSICEEDNITLNILVDINESIQYKYNPFCDYYNDKCNQNTSDYGTDIIINDRRNEFIINKMSLCEKNCIFKEYNSITKIVTCECKPKSRLRYLDEIQSETNNLYNSFDEINEITNLHVYTCYYVLFSKYGLLFNIGSYILIVIMLIYIITLNVFLAEGYNKLYEHIKNFVAQKLAIKPKKENNNKNKLLYDINTKHTDNNSIKNKRKNVESNNDNTDKNFSPLSKSEVQNINNHSTQNKQSKDLNINNNESFNDYELNNMNFDDAIKFDKRTYMQYYFSLLRTKHYILFSFVPIEDYNAMIIKIFLFFLSFVLYYDLNTLLFVPLIIHKIYLAQGSGYYLYLIGNIIISNIFCYIIDKLIKCVSLSQENILELKSMKTNLNNIYHKYLKTVKCLIIKYSLFFIFSFLFLLLSWYYIASFCAVYVNSQLILLICSLISFGLSLIYPLILNLIPGMFRIEPIKSGKKEKECKYNVSKILQSI